MTMRVTAISLAINCELEISNGTIVLALRLPAQQTSAGESFPTCKVLAPWYRIEGQARRMSFP